MKDFKVRPIAAKDDGAVADIIRTVMPEFGCSGPGFAIQDAEVDAMFSSYGQSGSAYFVIEHEGKILGGGGIAPLIGGDGLTCELRKMYFLPELRGKGLGQQLMDHCLTAAVQNEFKLCYLETMQAMTQARALYVRNGFEPLSAPLGATGHFSCDSWFLKSL